MNKFIKCELLITLFFGLTSCNSTSNHKYLNIYASFYPIYDFTTKIAKKMANVTLLTRYGSEPHDYEMTSADLNGMLKSDLIFINGLNLETWSNDVTEELRPKIREVSLGITPLKVQDAFDPHVWLDISLAKVEARNIKNSLCEADQLHCSYYTENYNDLVTRFDCLDLFATSALLPFKEQTIVVAHNAFSYFANHYSLKIKSLLGLEPNEEPTSSQINEIISTIKQENITTLFSEETMPKSIADKIASETNCSIDYLNPIEGLQKDSMIYEDYFSVMTTNINKVIRALKK